MDTMLSVDGHEIPVMEGPYVEAAKVTSAATEFGRKLIGMLPTKKKASLNSTPPSSKRTWPRPRSSSTTT